MCLVLFLSAKSDEYNEHELNESNYTVDFILKQLFQVKQILRMEYLVMMYCHLLGRHYII